ncbi:MAG: helix-turn-helix domain-containing protein [Clostridia bacterium]|nr:helix-turn-helix domain-containing protein [Clostridia bacterium]
MENNLAENIRKFRKSLGFTQEQLAERLGITLAAVSKWERGNSEPDLAYVMDLAEVFHVSVDALIGFSMHSTDADAEAERIEGLADEAPIEQIIEEYETALKKFPNHFRIVLGAAESYMRVGIMNRQEATIKRALELLRRSIDLISQNRDENISEMDIRNNIAQCYSNLKNYKKAIEEYKRNNIAGSNNARIGLLYTVKEGKPEEGILYTEKAFLGDISDMITATGGYLTYFGRTARYEEGLKTADWAIRFLESMKKDPSRGGFLDKILCLYYLDLAMMQDGMKMIEASEESLQRAVKMAAEFDRDPDYSLDNMILLDHLEKLIVYDDAGPTALDGMINTLEECGSSVSDEFRKKAINIIEAAKR